MRTNLQRNPRVIRIASALNADRLRVVGGLHAVWSLADEQTEDGKLDGYTFAVIDEIIGWSGFCKALEGVEWIAQDIDGVTFLRFEEHNGKTAKRRAQESDRKASARLSASDADKKRTREEKRREEKTNPSRASRSALNGAFTAFWDSYPRKKSKGDAEKAWIKIKPDEQLTERILHAVEQAKTSADWQRDGGQFVPYPASWLNAKGWEDETGRVRVIPAGGSEVIV